MDIDQDLLDHQNTRTFEAFTGKSEEDKDATVQSALDAEAAREPGAKEEDGRQGADPFRKPWESFWSYEYRHYLRSASPVEQKKVYTAFKKAGLALCNHGPRHDAILKSMGIMEAAIDKIIDEALTGKSEEDKDATEQENLDKAVEEITPAPGVPEVNPIPVALLPGLLVLMQTVYGGQLYVNAKNLITRYRLGACTKEEQNAQVITRFLQRNKVDTNGFTFAPAKNYGSSGISGYSSISYREIPGRGMMGEAFLGKSEEDKAETQKVKDALAAKKAAMTVMSNRELARRFVRDGLQRGRSYGSMRVAWQVLYSYATPIAIRNQGDVYVDTWRYSVTTSKQMSHLLAAGAHRIQHDNFMDLARDLGVDHEGRLQEAFTGKSEEDKENTAIDNEKRARAEALKKQAEAIRFKHEWKWRMDGALRDLEPDAIDEDGNGRIPIHVQFGTGSIRIKNSAIDYIEVDIDTDEAKRDILDREDELTEEWDKFFNENAKGSVGRYGKDDAFDAWLIVKKFHKDGAGYTGNWEDWRGDNFSYVQFSSSLHGQYIMIEDEIYSGDIDTFLMSQSESDESLFDGALDYRWGMKQFNRDLEKWVLLKGRNLEQIDKEELIGMIQDETNRYQYEDLDKMSDEELREVYTKVMTETEHESQMQLNLERKIGVLA